MEWKKVAALSLAATMTVALAACGNTAETNAGDSAASSSKSSSSSSSAEDGDVISYGDIKLGEDYKDLKTTIKVFNNRTDMLDDDYAGTNWATYIEEFNKLYPNIEVQVDASTTYAEDALLRLQGGDWGDVMMIPEVDKSDLGTYFLPYGDLSTMNKQVNYATKWSYDDQVYGIASTAVSRGVVYNKKVFQEAGITELPKTTEEFATALQTIKDKTEAIPLYTNYAAGWTMGAWDDYIAVTATGDAKYMNQVFLHTQDPFADTKDGAHAYNVYKVLYDAVASGLTEDDYTTTDWEGSKGMLNSGQIGCMVLGSWAYPQMQQAGPNADDIGYMPFPMSVDGKQYAAAAPDYCYGINKDSDADHQKAALAFVKFMTEQSGFSYNEGGLPIKAGDEAIDEKYPEVYQDFLANDIVFVPDEPAVKGEEDLLNSLNADSELMVAGGGNEKIQSLVEHAANKDQTFDEIMDEWNQKWSGAQEANGVEVQ